jgi:hypothetical protein
MSTPKMKKTETVGFLPVHTGTGRRKTGGLCGFQ